MTADCAGGRGGPGEPLLSVSGLAVEFHGPDGWVRVVDDLTFELDRSEVLGIVGESGSGKSVTSQSIAGLVQQRGGRIAAGSIRFGGREVTRLSPRELRELRANEIGMIFQQPTRCLNPAFTVGEQIAETVRVNRGATRAEAWREAVSMLDRVGIADAAQRASSYPHEFSGGMCQRVMIALALVGRPKLLIADEPTTALDVTIQAKILHLLRELQREERIAIILITHDLGVVAEFCDRTLLMHGGQAVEYGWTDELLTSPRHPYTEGLMGAVRLQREAGEFRTVPGVAPRPDQLVSGCRFHERCIYCEAGRCDREMPSLGWHRGGRGARCLRSDELRLTGIPPT